MSRWGQHAANLPANTLNTLVQGASGFAQMGVPQEYQQQAGSVPQFYPDQERAAPEGFWQKTADVVGGQLAPNLAALMVPGIGATKLARAAGLSERLALSAGDVAAGAIQAGAHNDPLAVPEFAAFGALRPLSLAARLAGGATLSAGAQAARGQNPLSGEGMARMGADALFSGIDRLPVERGPVRAPEVPMSGPGVPVGSPYTRETLRLGYPSPEVPSPVRGPTLALPEPPVSISEYGAPIVDRFQQPALPYRADITVAPNGAAFTREQINDPRSLAEMFRRRDVIDVAPSDFREAPTPAAIDRSTSETLTRPSVEAEMSASATQPTVLASGDTRLKKYISEYKPEPNESPDRSKLFAMYQAAEKIAIEEGMDWKDMSNGVWQGIMRGDATPNDVAKFLKGYEVGDAPKRPVSYSSKPELPTDEAINARALEMWKEQYKAKFPGKRTNSNAANESWQKVKDQAYKFAKVELEKRHARDVEAFDDRNRGPLLRYKQEVDKFNARKREVEQVSRLADIISTESKSAVDPVQAKQQADAEVVVPKVEPPKEPSAFNANIKAAIKKRQQTGAVDMSILDDIVGHGRSLYEAGMKFPEWAGRMIKEFGEGIGEFLQESWRRIRHAASTEPYRKAQASMSPGEKAMSDIQRTKAEYINMSERSAKSKDPTMVSSWWNKHINDPDSPGAERIRKFTDSLKEQHPYLREVITKHQGYVNYMLEKTDDVLKAVETKMFDLPEPIRARIREFGDGKITEREFMADTSIPQDIKAEYPKLLAIQEELQRNILAGEASPAKRAIVEKTLKIFTTRAYEVDTNPKFKFTDAALNDVVDEMAKVGEFGGNREQIREYVKAEFNDRRFKRGQVGGEGSGGVRIERKIYEHRMLTPDEKANLLREKEADVANAKAELETATTEQYADKKAKAKAVDPLYQKVANLTRDLDEIKGAKVISDAWRRFYGEITDPVLAKARTIAKILPSAANAQALGALDNIQIGGYKAAMTRDEYLSAREADPNMSRYDSPSDNIALGPIKGKYLHPEVTSAINTVQGGASALMEFLDKTGIAWINSQMKQNFTVRNPGTVSRNYMMMPVFLFASRNFNPAEWKRSYHDLKSGGKIEIDGKMVDLVDEAKRNGVMGSSFVSQEVVRNAEELLGYSKRGIDPLKPLKKADKWAQEKYKFTDDFVRWTTYRNMRKNYGMSPEQALRFVDRYTHNYGNVPQGWKVARQLPLVNPFLSYNYEMFRTLKHLAEDVGNSSLSPKERLISGGILTTIVALPLGVKAAFEAALPEDEKKEWDRMWRMSPDYAKGQIRIPGGKNKEGAFNYLNADPFSPAGDYSKILLNLYNRNYKGIIDDNPVVGLKNTPLLTALSEVISGEETISRKPVEQNMVGLAKAVARNMAPPLTGGYAGKEMVKSFTPNREGGLGITDHRTGREYSPQRFIPTLFGVRVGQQRLSNLLQGAKFEQRDEKAAAQREFKSIFRTDRTDEAIEKARLDFLNKRKKIDAKFLEKTR